MRSDQLIIIGLDDYSKPIYRTCMLDLAKASAIHEADFSDAYSTHDPKTGLGGIGWRQFRCVAVVVEGITYHLDRKMEDVVKLSNE